jgi:integrase
LRQVERFAEGKTGAKATAKLKQALTEIQVSTAADVKRETRVRDLGERFLLSKAKLSPRTLGDYKRIVHNVINPRIGDLAIAEATADRLQRTIDAIAAEKGPGAAQNARAVLSGMMGLAARSDAVKANPVRELASVESSGEKGALSIPLVELPALLDAVRGDDRLREIDMVELIELMAGTGLRIHEACALRWDDVELETGVISVRKSKTTAGVRRIQVPAAVTGMLVGRRVSGEQNYSGVVFPTVLGKERDTRAAHREWADARARLNLPDRYTFHSFRKTVATALDQAGLTPRDIAEYLGHTNPALTQTVYMSKTVGGNRAANALDSILSK